MHTTPQAPDWTSTLLPAFLPATGNHVWAQTPTTSTLQLLHLQCCWETGVSRRRTRSPSQSQTGCENLFNPRLTLSHRRQPGAETDRGHWGLHRLPLTLQQSLAIFKLSCSVPCLFLPTRMLTIGGYPLHTLPPCYHLTNPQFQSLCSHW